jgi:hypothetical protein
MARSPSPSRWLAALWLAASWSGLGCAGPAGLSGPQRQELRARLQGQLRYTSCPLFIAPFYAYPDRLFLSLRAFDERILIERASGEPILPGPTLGVLPLGTRVRIQDIDFPTAAARAERELRSPRHFVWVLVETPDGELDKPGVLVLTGRYRDGRRLLDALDDRLVAGDPRARFAGRPAAVRRAIDRKQPAVGMRLDALLRARGRPDRVLRRMVEGVRVERLCYGPGRTVTLHDGVVVDWRGFAAPPPDRQDWTPAEGIE